SSMIPTVMRGMSQKRPGHPTRKWPPSLSRLVIVSLRRREARGAVNALTRAARLSPSPTDRGRRLAEAAFIGADVSGELSSVSALLADAGRASAEDGPSLEEAAAAAFLLLVGDGDVDTAHTLLVSAIEHRVEIEK